MITFSLTVVSKQLIIIMAVLKILQHNKFGNYTLLCICFCIFHLYTSYFYMEENLGGKKGLQIRTTGSLGKKQTEDYLKSDLQPHI